MSPQLISLFSRVAGVGSPSPPPPPPPPAPAPAPAPASDIGGWNAYTPVTTNGTTNATRSNYTTMTGTRLHYVDPSQTVATTMLALDQAATWNASTNPHGGPYLWSGTAIIDMSGNLAPLTGPNTGVAYGTDPTQPSAAVQTFKRVSYCASNRFGNNRLNGTVHSGNYVSAGTTTYNSGAAGRNGMPDWTLIKRGTTLSLEDDFYDLGLEGDPALVRAALFGTLAVAGGNSLSAMSLVRDFGSLTLPRPRITKFNRNYGFINRTGAVGVKSMEFTAYVGLNFDGHDRAHAPADIAGFSALYNTGTPGLLNVWFEDCMWDGDGGWNFSQNTDIQIAAYRTLFFDTFGGHVSGIFEDNQGASGIKLQQCIMARNGKTNDPVLNNGGADSIYDRNWYQSGEGLAAYAAVDDCIFLPGGSADQFRAGVHLTRSYFMGSGISLTGQNGNAGVGAPNTGSAIGNVFERYYKNNPAHSGAGGVALFYGAKNVEVGNCVVTDAGLSPADRITTGAVGDGAGGLSVGGSSTGWYYEQLTPTQSCRQHHNVVINRAGGVSMRSEEGIKSSDLVGVTTNFVATGVGAYRWNDTGRRASTTATAALAASANVIPLAVASPSGGLACVAGLNIGIVLATGLYHWTTVLSIAGLNATLTTALPSNALNGAVVTYAKQANYDYPITLNNTFDYNLFIGTSAPSDNSKYYLLRDVAGATAVDSTTYANNSRMTTAAAATAGHNIDRCMYTYCLTAGFTPSSSLQDTVTNELVVYWKANMWRGQFNPAWTGKPVVNHVFGGLVGLVTPVV